MVLTLVTAPTAEPVSLTEAKAHLRVDISTDDTLIEALIMAAREYCEGFQRRAYVTQTRELILDRFPSTGATIELPMAPLRSVSSIKYTDKDGVETTWAASNYIADTKSEPGRVSLGYGKSWPSTTLRPINGVSIRYVVGYTTPFTANVTTDTLTAVGHPYANGDVVRISNTGGAVPAGLSTLTDYYVIGVSGNTLQLSATSGGSAIDITGVGTGTHFLGVVPQKVRQAMLLLIGHWYENRELYLTGTMAAQLQFTVESLLWLDRVF